MKEAAAVLDNGTRLELVRHALYDTAIFGVRWEDGQGHTLLFFADRLELKLHLNASRQAFESAALAGSAIERRCPTAPFALYLLLAFVAHKHDLPDRADERRISAVAVFVSPEPPVGEITDEELRQHAPLAFEPRGSEFFQLAPADKWNPARFLLHCGDHAWKLRGQQARFWGSFPTGGTLQHEEEARLQRGVLARLAALALTPRVWGQLSIPMAQPDQPEFAWWDWMALVVGPHPPQRALRPGGLGELHGAVLETNLDPYALALSVKHALALKTVAATLLLEQERPYPRYIGRLLDVRLPLRLLPLLRRWGIARLLVQVEATGLYASVLDQAGECIGAAWWEAGPRRRRALPHEFPGRRLDPPARHPRCVLEGRLRQRHPGWPQAAHNDRRRHSRSDFQRRRALAIERARAAVQPDPLPGFTFVHRLTEEERLAQTTGKPATPVVARGLLALSLVLQEEAIGVASDEEES